MDNNTKQKNIKIVVVTVILIVALLLGGVLVTVMSTTKDQNNNKALSDTAGKYVVNSTFLVKDGKVIKNDPSIKQEDVIDWYVDPFCPACIKLEGMLNDKLDTISKEMTIRFHVLSFLSAKTIDDYSNRAAAYILATVETTPELGVDYYKYIMSDKFAPQPGSGNKTDETKFKEALIAVKGTNKDWAKIQKVAEKYKTMVKEDTAKAFNSKELLEKSPTGRLTVPYIIIGNSQKALNFSDSMDAEEYFLSSLDSYQKDMKAKKAEANKKAEETKDTQKTKAE